MTHPFQICISGAAKGPSVELSHGFAKEIAREVVARGHIVLTGATDGLPYYAAKAARAAGGTSVGFSPAASPLAHIKRYHLPLDAFDTVVYTGFGYSGRNLLLVRSADALIMVGGRIGTLNELTIALEEKTPVGVLLGSGGMTDEVDHVLKAARRSRANIILGDEPKKLVDDVIKLVAKRHKKLGG